MYYHFAILLLFRPFIKLVFSQSAVSPRDICTQAAENISSLVRSYRHLYTIRRTPSFSPYIVFAANITHLMDARNMLGSAYSVQGLQDLRDMSSCHGFAKKAIHIINAIAQKWGISIKHLTQKADESAKQVSGGSLTPQLKEPYFLDVHETLPSLQWTQETDPSQLVLPKPLFQLFPNQGLPDLDGPIGEIKAPELDDGMISRGIEGSLEAKLRNQGFEFATIHNTTTLNQGAFQQYGSDRQSDGS
jgi:hypothetical protein